jgi:uncharacterized protein (UPF0332 family)
VKPESAAYLDKARGFLDQAETMLRVNLIEAAGRTAYLAAFHAAQAFIFETTGRIYKRHATVQSEFGRLTRNDVRVADELRAFLPQSYQLKAIADYETGPGSHISEQTARAALTTARRFIECVTSLIDIAP